MTIRYKDFLDIALTTSMGENLKNTESLSKGVLGARVYYQDTWTTRVKGVILLHRHENVAFPAVNSPYVTAALSAGYILIHCKRWEGNPAYRVNDSFPNYNSAFPALEQQSYIEFVYRHLRYDPIFTPYIVASTRYLLCGDGDGARQQMTWSAVVNDPGYAQWRNLVLGVYASAPIPASLDGLSWMQVGRVMRAQANACANMCHPCKVVYPIADQVNQVRTMSELISVSNGNPLVEIEVFGGSTSYDNNWVSTFPAVFMNEVVKFANSVF